MGVRLLSEIVLSIISWLNCTYSHQIFTVSVSSIWIFSLEDCELYIMLVCFRGKSKPIIDEREGKRLWSIEKKLLSRIADFGCQEDEGVRFEWIG